MTDAINAADDIIALYDRTAAAWAAARRPVPAERAWLRRFATDIAPGAHLLDIGCGTGDPIARWLIAQGFAVTGIDASAALIAIARERLPQARWQVADMRGLALGQRFDGLLAWHSFFHLTHDDQRAMFPRFAAHAAPGAPLMFTSGSEHGVAIGEWQGQPLFHASLSPDEYRALLEANGFAVEDFRAGEPVAEGPSLWLARRRA